ncbi:hypothetical protein ACTG9Q_13685 [Actinokineospora sp. 24-640]
MRTDSSHPLTSSRHGVDGRIPAHPLHRPGADRPDRLTHALGATEPES